MKTIIITETINVNEKEVLDVDPIILMNMRERLNPPKPFSHDKEVQAAESDRLEKLMREKSKK